MAGVRTLFGVTSFGNVKQQCGRRSNFVLVNSFWKFKIATWQAFEISLGSTIFGNVKQQRGRR
jgi:hypothetical protein